MTTPTELSKFDINPDSRDAEFGQLAADRSGSFTPTLTWDEYHDERAARAELRQSSVSRDAITCPDCAAVLVGRRSFRHHVKDVHKWKPKKLKIFLSGRLTVYICPCSRCKKRFSSLAGLNEHGRKRHGLTSKEISHLRHPVPVVPDKPPESLLPKEDVEILRKSGMSMKEIQALSALSPEVRQVLKMPISGRMSRAGSLIAEPSGEAPKDSVTDMPTETSPPIKLPAPTVPLYPSQLKSEMLEKVDQNTDQQYQDLFNSPLKSIVPDERDRECFLYFLLGQSLQKIAITLFSDGARKPHVQKMVNRARDRFRNYQTIGRKNGSPEDWEITVSKLLKKREKS